MNARNDGSPGYTDKELEEPLGEDSSEEGLTSSVTVCGRITTPQRTSVSLRLPDLKIGANFQGQLRYHHAVRLHAVAQQWPEGCFREFVASHDIYADKTDLVLEAVTYPGLYCAK